MDISFLLKFLLISMDSSLVISRLYCLMWTYVWLDWSYVPRLGRGTSILLERNIIPVLYVTIFLFVIMHKFLILIIHIIEHHRKDTIALESSTFSFRAYNPILKKYSEVHKIITGAGYNYQFLLNKPISWQCLLNPN